MTSISTYGSQIKDEIRLPIEQVRNLEVMLEITYPHPAILAELQSEINMMRTLSVLPSLILAGPATQTNPNRAARRAAKKNKKK
jgi:hypothetical protein